MGDRKKNLQSLRKWAFLMAGIHRRMMKYPINSIEYDGKRFKKESANEELLYEANEGSEVLSNSDVREPAAARQSVGIFIEK